MKNKIKIINIVIFIAIYCLVIGLFSNISSLPNYSVFQSSSQESSITVSKTRFFHTSQTETLVCNCLNFNLPNFKNLHLGIWAFVRANELLFESKYIQYAAFTCAILINLRKTDIIFPFQYFW